MNNIKTEPSSHDNDINTATTSIYVKKKDDDHDDGNDDCSPITSPSPSSSSHGRLYGKVKKEEEEGSSSSSPEATATPASSSASPRIVVKKEEEENNGSKNEDNVDNYSDWKAGNWCWVLPSTTSDEGKTAQRQSQQNGFNNHSVKSEGGGDLNTNAHDTIPTTVSNRKRTARNRNTSINNEDTPKKKKTRLLPPPHHPSNIRNKTTEEDDSGYDEEVSNPNITDSNDSGNNKADDDGYESWTEGNWCLLLRSSRTNSEQDLSSDEEIEYTEITTRSNRPVRNSFSSCLETDDEDEDEDREISNATNSKRQQKRWNVMFRRLVSYKNQYNSTSVPQKYALDLELGHWVQNQRGFYRNEKISDYRIDRLESIGFVWKILDNQWDEMFNRLITYKNQHHGSTQVPVGYEKDPKFAAWVCTQRWNYNQSKKILSVDRIKRLESIGFVWDVLDMKWMKMYDQLRAYKNKHKSTQVPRTYTADNQLTCLGYWVYKQRSYYRDGKLLKKRVECLNSIDFAWEVK